MRRQFKARRKILLLIATSLLLVAALAPFGSSAKPQATHRRAAPSPKESPATTTDAKRFALVIGNDAYGVAALKNPVNDARAVARALRECQFDVSESENLSQTGMKQAIRAFGEKLRAGGRTGVGLFYYAGHGVQVSDRNYLIPIGANINNEEEVEYEAVDVGFVMAQMEAAGNDLNIVILDACRDNPYAHSFRSMTRGLALMAAPTSSLIAYSTAPGKTASDGAGGNGLFTAELLAAMRTPGLAIEDVFKQVRVKVLEKSSGNQVPWEASSLTGDFYFTPANDGAARDAETANTSSRLTADESAMELTFWETIKSSTDAEDFKAYLAQYPTGRFAALAKRRVATLTASSSSSANNDEATRAGSKSLVSAGNLPAAVTNRIGLALVKIPPGSFMMGATNGEANEQPVHQVTISAPFYLGKYEVTQAQWLSVMGNNPSEFKGADQPVEQVSWDDAQEFIRKLNALGDGFEYRLPSEAEWEYACRAGTNGDFAGDLDAMAWYSNNSKGGTHPVGQKQPNKFGLYDMHGNVWEWCADMSPETYQGAPGDGSAWSDAGSQKRILRGGSWDHDGGHARSAYRHWFTPNHHTHGIGFRVVAVPRASS
jgi:formylglycine-generating enzyme required for sulfatase activity